jgi:methyl-accepting chemotaxis protein
MEQAQRATIEEQLFAQRKSFADAMSLFTMLGTGVAGLAMLGVWLAFPEFTQLLLAAILYAVMVVTSIIYRVLARSGQTVAGFYLLMLTILAACVGLPLLMPALMVAVAPIYVFTLMVANLLLPRRVSLLLIPLDVALFSGTIVASNTFAADWFPPMGATIDLVLNAFISGLAMLVVAIVARYITLSQHEANRRALEAGQQIEAQIHLEQEQRVQLEHAQLEIEARATAEQSHRERLESLIQQIQEVVTLLNGAMTEILAATTQQMALASQQEAAVLETITTVEQVRATVQQTAERSQLVSNQANDSVTVTRMGQEAVDDTINGMEAVQDRVTDIAENILMLSERTQQIGEIIASVEELAEQSKLLALNASIEAARAGEEGRGFAVVAMEVRQLAEQSRTATARVREILGEIQQATNTAVMVTEEGSKEAQQGMQLVSRAGESIADLTATIEASAEQVSQIAVGAQQQRSGVEQLLVAMQSIKQASTQAAASTRQVEASLHELNGMAQRMNEMAQQAAE